ncbi:MAG TPA: beta galactosidase jelly roll domain-containing protein, partial [bacterium]|nr:beta galactosidase jelly roll domain-containing protein [bacterium]
MNSASLLRRLATIAVAVLTSTAIAADDASPREHLSLDANWKFHLGDDWPNALRLDKAGSSGGPAAEKFSDQAWRSINLPHDWAIELPFDRASDTSHGYKPVGPGYTKNNVGWYRRTFELSPDDAGKRIWLTFDGAFRDTTVWVNGWLVKRHEGGYYPFREDITDVVKFGGKNVIAVKVDASKFEGWFYEGAGIYRHVWLDKTAPVAIAPEGVFVYSKFKDNIPEGPVELYVQTKMLNTGGKAGPSAFQYEVFDPEGKSITSVLSMTTLIEQGETKHEDRLFTISKYSLWSPESPKLYKLVTTVSVNGKMVDQKETSFGVRTAVFDPDKGFVLNGKPYPIYGTCNHQDHAGVG